MKTGSEMCSDNFSETAMLATLCTYTNTTHNPNAYCSCVTSLSRVTSMSKILKKKQFSLSLFDKDLIFRFINHRTKNHQAHHRTIWVISTRTSIKLASSKP